MSQEKVSHCVSSLSLLLHNSSPLSAGSSRSYIFRLSIWDYLSPQKYVNSRQNCANQYFRIQIHISIFQMHQHLIRKGQARHIWCFYWRTLLIEIAYLVFWLMYLTYLLFCLVYLVLNFAKAQSHSRSQSLWKKVRRLFAIMKPVHLLHTRCGAIYIMHYALCNM